jgi:hypothetical protein
MGHLRFGKDIAQLASCGYEDDFAKIKGERKFRHLRSVEWRRYTKKAGPINTRWKSGAGEPRLT